MLICTTKKIVLFQYYKELFQYYFVLLYTTQYYILQYYSSNSPVLLCTTKYYSVIQSTNPGLLCTTQYYSNTTPYKKALLQHYAVLFHYYPSTTLLLLCYALQVFLLPLQTKTINQPASQFGRPAGEHGTDRTHGQTKTINQPARQFGRPAGEHGNGRPAGTHGSGRPDGRETAGRPAGNEIANKSPVLSYSLQRWLFLHITCVFWRKLDRLEQEHVCLNTLVTFEGLCLLQRTHTHVSVYTLRIQVTTCNWWFQKMQTCCSAHCHSAGCPGFIGWKLSILQLPSLKLTAKAPENRANSQKETRKYSNHPTVSFRECPSIGCLWRCYKYSMLLLMVQKSHSQPPGMVLKPCK